MATHHNDSEIKSLLIAALTDQNLNGCNIEIVGSSAKGDGFIGDVYFVNLITKRNIYNFILKCSKCSEALRKGAPIKNAFNTEIYMYKTVFPAFRQFEIAHNIHKVFNSIPKYYGSFTCENKEVVVLHNLKAVGYELWDKKLPLPRDHIETVLKQYGRLHAISAAMQDQAAEAFEKLISNLPDVWAEFCNTRNFSNMYISAIESIEKIWENQMDEDILNGWKALKDYAEFYVMNLRKKSKFFNVITHGDCWNNNFMFHVTDNGIEVAILDWQMPGFTSPVIDVSDFLYSCISEADLKDFDDLVMIYYTSFAGYLKELGSDPEKIYTYSNLLNDWKIYGIYGILHASTVFRVLSASADDLVDIAEVAERGDDISLTFCPNIDDVEFIKRRTKHIIEHAVERNLIEPIKKFW